MYLNTCMLSLSNKELDDITLLSYVYLVNIVASKTFPFLLHRTISLIYVMGHSYFKKYVCILYILFVFLLSWIINSILSKFTWRIDRNPNKAGSGDPYWPSYKSRKAYLQLDDHVTARHDLLSQRLVTLIETVPRIMANENNVGQHFG